MARKYDKALLIRFPKELHQQMREAVAYLETDMTTLINRLVDKEVKKVIKERNQELAERETFKSHD